MIVQNRLTPLASADAARALFAAYAQLAGSQPSDSVGALLLSQSALETGNWQKLHNFNFGNLKARADYPQIVQFRCSEVIDGVERFFDPPDPQCNFRAYASATEGAVDYLKVLRGQPHWWRGLQSGDPSAFVDALATPPKYFTADPERYKRTLVALYQQFRPLAVAAPRMRPPAAPAAPASPSPLPSSPSASSSPPSVLQSAPAKPAGSKAP
jgi:flagellum-specific peptidoglycan hydrolase FlgJ